MPWGTGRDQCFNLCRPSKNGSLIGSSATQSDFFSPPEVPDELRIKMMIFSVLFLKPMAEFSPDRWFSQCLFQESGQELVNGLKACLEGQCPIKVGVPDSIPVVVPQGTFGND